MTLSARVLSSAACVRVCLCVRVCQCVCVWECQGGGDVFITASSSFCFHQGNQSARSVFFFVFFCFLLERKRKKDGCDFLFLFFLPFCFFHCGCYLHTYIYVRWNSWQAKGASRRVGCRMAHYKDVSVRKTSLNLVTGFFQYLRGK